MHGCQPFRPFDIHPALGRALPVEHPELLAIAPPGRQLSLTNCANRHEPTSTSSAAVAASVFQATGSMSLPVWRKMRLRPAALPL
jgi:hypothetical protein